MQKLQTNRIIEEGKRVSWHGIVFKNKRTGDGGGGKGGGGGVRGGGSGLSRSHGDSGRRGEAGGGIGRGGGLGGGG